MENGNILMPNEQELVDPTGIDALANIEKDQYGDWVEKIKVPQDELDPEYGY